MAATTLTDRSVVRLSGEDVRGFVQGLVSSDVAGPLPVWAGLLTPQGKCLFDFMVWGDGDDLLLDCEASAADDLIKHVTDDTIASAQKIFSRMDSVGQQRMAQLHGGRRDKLEISPNLWAGVGLVRGGAGTALVGDPETVAARIREYQGVGIDTFILSGYPHLEEAYRFAELVFPLLKLERLGNVTPIRVNTGPFGETIANEHRPEQRASQS